MSQKPNISRSYKSEELQLRYAFTKMKARHEVGVIAFRRFFNPIFCTFSSNPLFTFYFFEFRRNKFKQNKIVCKTKTDDHGVKLIGWEKTILWMCKQGWQNALQSGIGIFQTQLEEFNCSYSTVEYIITLFGISSSVKNDGVPIFSPLVLLLEVF